MSAAHGAIGARGVGGTERLRALHERLPRDFHQVLLTPAGETRHEDVAELSAYWGAAWGADDEVGRLRHALVRAPGDELLQVDGDRYDPALDALVDPDGRWYWTGRQPPDLARARAQHAALVAALRACDVEVTELGPHDPRDVKALYVRDPLTTVRGGAIIGRMAPRVRRGEEADVTRTVAGLGVPILATIAGRGRLEGGSVVKLRPGLAAVGLTVRVNADGADQLGDALRHVGWDLLRVPVAGFSIHLDLHLAMVDTDKALVEPSGLPYWFLERLGDLGFECLWVHPEEPWGVNCLALSPGTVLMSESAPRTAALLERRGLTVVTVPYDELERNGGGIHCSTMELLRDPA